MIQCNKERESAGAICLIAWRFSAPLLDVLAGLFQDVSSDPKPTMLHLASPDHHQNRGGFSGAVGTDEPVNASLGDIQVQAVEHRSVAKALERATARSASLTASS